MPMSDAVQIHAFAALPALVQEPAAPRPGVSLLSTEAPEPLGPDEAAPAPGLALVLWRPPVFPFFMSTNHPGAAGAVETGLQGPPPSEQHPPEEPPPSAAASAEGSAGITLTVEEVRIRDLRPRSFRTRFGPEDPEEFAVLTASVREIGLLTAPVVRGLPSGEREIVTHERAIHAAEAAGLERIRVTVRAAVSESAAMRLAFVGDAASKPLTEWERALFVADYQQTVQKEGRGSLSQRALRDELATPLATVNGCLKIARLEADLIEDGRDVESVNHLPRDALLHIARGATREERIRRLEERLTPKSPKPKAPRGEPAAASVSYSPEEGGTIRVPPIRDLRPAEAGRLADQLDPLVEALRARAADPA